MKSAKDKNREVRKKNKVVLTDWKECYLGDYMELISGQHLVPGEYNEEKVGIPYFTGPSDFTNEIDKIIKWTNKKTKHAIDEDVLITVKGSGVGQLHFLEIEKPVAIGRQLMAIRRKNSNARFLYYLLLFKGYQIEVLSRGNMIPGVTRDDIIKLKVLFPPVPEQQKIARILSTWDKAIEKTEQLIAQKQQLKKGLMQQLLTGKVRFKEFVKSSYQIKTLAECIIGKGDYGINAAGVIYSKLLPTYLRITDIDDFGGFIASSKVSVDHPDSSSFYLKEGDIVFARTGNTTGKTYLYNPKDGKLVFAGFLIRFTLNAKILLPEFLKLYTETEKYWNWVKITSSRSGQPGINSQEYCNLEIPVPKIEEQEKIARLLNSFDYEIDVLRKELLLFNLQKKGLMQQLLTGKLRVKHS